MQASAHGTAYTEQPRGDDPTPKRRCMGLHALSNHAAVCCSAVPPHLWSSHCEVKWTRVIAYPVQSVVACVSRWEGQSSAFKLLHTRGSMLTETCRVYADSKVPINEYPVTSAGASACLVCSGVISCYDKNCCAVCRRPRSGGGGGGTIAAAAPPASPAPAPYAAPTPAAPPPRLPA